MSINSSGRARGRWGRRIALSVTTILASGFAAPALAQSAHPNLDANGVDLTTGTFNLRLPIASVGSGQAELPLIAYDGQTDNWSGLFLTKSVSGGVTSYVVNLGPEFDNFTSASSSSTRGTGATLTDSGGMITYRSLDGVLITFSNLSTEGGTTNFCTGDSAESNPCTLPATQVSGKSGLTVNLNWDVHENCPQGIDPENCIYSWRLAGVGNAAGYSISWAFATDNGGTNHQNPGTSWYRRTSATLANGGATTGTVTYANPSTGVYTITTPGSRTWRIAGSGNAITAIRRPSASSDTTTISYSSGIVTSVTRDGITTGYSRSVSGSTATMVVTDAQSHTTTVVSDMTKYRPTSVTDPLGKVTSFTYDTLGRPTEVSAPEGNKVQYAYDSRGNLTTTTRKAKTGSGLSDIVTTANYDSSCSNIATCNSPNYTQDALGNQTDYTYDSSTGLLLTVTAPAATSGAKRPQTRYSYAANGAGISLMTGISQCQTGATSDTPSCVGTADEVKTTLAYDANLNTTSTTTAAGDNGLSAVTTGTYDSAGNLLTVDGPLSGASDTTTFRYDADRNRVGVISADPDGAGSLKRRAVKTTYNTDGQPTVTEIGTVTGTDDTAWTAFSSAEQSTATYDANGFKTKDVVAASSTTYKVTQYSYDAVGRLECTAVRMNSSVWGSLPSSACSLGTVGSYGDDHIAKTTYDAAGHSTKVQTGYGVTGTQADDITTSYTDNGQIASVTDAEGNKTSYSYDGHDRLWKTFYPSTTKGAGTSSSTDYVQVTYDANDEVTSQRLRDGNSIAFGYDHLGRPTTKDLPGSELDVTYSYDLLGRMTTTATSAQTLTFGFDALSRNTSQGGPLGTVSYQYDAAGSRTRMTWPDNFYVTYDYQVTGEVTAIKESGSTSLATYTYDDLGRRISLTRGNGTTATYGFDSVSRLASLGHNLDGSATTNDVTTTFGYSPASQIASQTRTNDGFAWGGQNLNHSYTSNGLNQFTAWAGTSLGYDTRGNLNAWGTDSYTYSSENMMTGAPGSVTLAYDPLLRLYQTAGSTTTRFQYDGTNLIGEYNSSNVLQKRYVFGPGIDEPLVEYAGSGTGSGVRTFLHTDERGSVIARSNESGATVAINSYDEYGYPANHVDGSGHRVSDNVGRFQYTGQTWLPEVGMYYYKARIYSPTLGRFMQTDPIGYGDGMNWYNYVRNDPVNRQDPSGLKCKDTTGPDCIDDEEIIARGKPREAGAGGGDPFWSPSGSIGFDPPRCNFANNWCTTLRPAPTPPPPSKPKPGDCAYRNPRTGKCIYVVDKNGKLKFSPEYQVEACKINAALQDGATKANDGYTAIGVGASARGGKYGQIVGWFATFAASISSISTGAGFRPFGITIIPKSPPPPGC